MEQTWPTFQNRFGTALSNYAIQSGWYMFYCVHTQKKIYSPSVERKIQFYIDTISHLSINYLRKIAFLCHKAFHFCLFVILKLKNAGGKENFLKLLTDYTMNSNDF